MHTLSFTGAVRASARSFLVVVSSLVVVEAPSQERVRGPDAVFTLVERLTSQPSTPGGVCVDRLGYTYVADYGETVWRISPHGDVQEYARGFYGAAGNAIDAEGNLLQANRLAGTARQKALGGRQA